MAGVTEVLGGGAEMLKPRIPPSSCTLPSAAPESAQRNRGGGRGKGLRNPGGSCDAVTP